MQQKRRIYCKYCDFFCREMDDYVDHLEKEHLDFMPPDMTAWQFAYYLRTGKTHGSCIMCKKNTTWNEKIHKYNRLCGSDACKEKYVAMFKKRMIGRYGKTTLLTDPDQQKKMLANRSISGEYHWSDHVHTTTYTGSYEKEFLEFIDNVMQFEPTDVIMPSPHTYWYEYEGAKHFYIPDAFIVSLDLEVEIKDGGDNPNNHPKILMVDKEKERLKDAVVKTSSFNYLKIPNKDHKKFLAYLEKAKDYNMNQVKGNIFMD